MNETADQPKSLSDILADQSYWPAMAARNLAGGKFSEVVHLCRQRLIEQPYLLSGRIVLAKALLRIGQVEQAREQLYAILAADPDHLAALKLLGDCSFSQGDEFTALSHYQRVLEIDPDCCGLVCDRHTAPTERHQTITLVRPEEPAPIETTPLRNIPFYTETMGDLYLAQGYPRLAASVFRLLHERSRHPRLLEKLSRAQESIKAKE